MATAIAIPSSRNSPLPTHPANLNGNNTASHYQTAPSNTDRRNSMAITAVSQPNNSPFVAAVANHKAVTTASIVKGNTSRQSNASMHPTINIITGRSNAVAAPRHPVTAMALQSSHLQPMHALPITISNAANIQQTQGGGFKVTIGGHHASHHQTHSHPPSQSMMNHHTSPSDSDGSAPPQPNINTTNASDHMQVGEEKDLSNASDNQGGGGVMVDAEMNEGSMGVDASMMESEMAHHRAMNPMTAAVAMPARNAAMNAYLYHSQYANYAYHHQLGGQGLFIHPGMIISAEEAAYQMAAAADAKARHAAQTAYEQSGQMSYATPFEQNHRQHPSHVHPIHLSSLPPHMRQHHSMQQTVNGDVIIHENIPNQQIEEHYYSASHDRPHSPSYLHQQQSIIEGVGVEKKKRGRKKKDGVPMTEEEIAEAERKKSEKKKKKQAADGTQKKPKKKKEQIIPIETEKGNNDNTVDEMITDTVEPSASPDPELTENDEPQTNTADVPIMETDTQIADDIVDDENDENLQAPAPPTKKSKGKGKGKGGKKPKKPKAAPLISSTNESVEADVRSKPFNENFQAGRHTRQTHAAIIGDSSSQQRINSFFRSLPSNTGRRNRQNTRDNASAHKRKVVTFRLKPPELSEERAFVIKEAIRIRVEKERNGYNKNELLVKWAALHRKTDQPIKSEELSANKLNGLPMNGPTVKELPISSVLSSSTISLLQHSMQSLYTSMEKEKEKVRQHLAAAAIERAKREKEDLQRKADEEKAEMEQEKVEEEDENVSKIQEEKKTSKKRGKKSKKVVQETDEKEERATKRLKAESDDKEEIKDAEEEKIVEEPVSSPHKKKHLLALEEKETELRTKLIDTQSQFKEVEEALKKQALAKQKIFAALKNLLTSEPKKKIITNKSETGLSNNPSATNTPIIKPNTISHSSSLSSVPSMPSSSTSSIISRITINTNKKDHPASQQYMKPSPSSSSHTVSSINSPNRSSLMGNRPMSIIRHPPPSSSNFPPSSPTYPSSSQSNYFSSSYDRSERERDTRDHRERERERPPPPPPQREPSIQSRDRFPPSTRDASFSATRPRMWPSSTQPSLQNQSAQGSSQRSAPPSSSPVHASPSPAFSPLAAPLPSPIHYPSSSPPPNVSYAERDRFELESRPSSQPSAPTPLYPSHHFRQEAPRASFSEQRFPSNTNHPPSSYSRAPPPPPSSYRYPSQPSSSIPPPPYQSSQPPAGWHPPPPAASPYPNYRYPNAAPPSSPAYSYDRDRPRDARFDRDPRNDPRSDHPQRPPPPPPPSSNVYYRRTSGPPPPPPHINDRDPRDQRHYRPHTNPNDANWQ